MFSQTLQTRHSPTFLQQCLRPELWKNRWLESLYTIVEDSSQLRNILMFYLRLATNYVCLRCFQIILLVKPVVTLTMYLLSKTTPRAPVDLHKKQVRSHNMLLTLIIRNQYKNKVKRRNCVNLYTIALSFIQYSIFSFS